MSSTGDGYLKPGTIDWPSLQAATFAVRQSLRYEYPGPIEDLHQVLLLVPPDQCAGQTLLSYDVSVLPFARPRFGSDAYGNRVTTIVLPRVDGSLAFAVSLRVERRRWPHLPAPQPAGGGEPGACRSRPRPG